MAGLCIAAAFGMVAAGAAQERTSSAGDQRASSSTGKAADNALTVTGCLSRDADGKFMLNDIARNGEANKPPETTTATGASSATTSGRDERAPHEIGTSGALGNKAEAHSWLLDGKNNDLSDHVGQRIEVTGRMAPGTAASTTTREGAPATANTNGASGAGADAPAHFQVESVKTVTPSCGS